MKTVNVQMAKTHLSRLIEEVISGETIVLAKAGKPLVVLTPYRETRGPRQGGQLRGQLGDIPDDFDVPCPEIDAMFHS